MLALLLPLAGCTLSSPPPVDPVATVADVELALDELVERFATGDPLAADAWAAAHARFEADLEPLLRERVDAVDVARTEYAFGRVRRAVADGDDPREAVQALVHRLQDQVGAPRSVAAR